MRKKRLPLLFLLLVAALPLQGRGQKARDVNIEITLFQTGNAVIHERWDVDTGDEITEWYLVRSNLGDITISDFKVYDGDTTKLADDGEWDVNRTREQKAGRSGGGRGGGGR